MIKQYQKIIFVILFGIIFGLLEAIVVVYLRQLFGSGNTLISRQISQDDIALTFGLITFLKPTASILITQSQRILSLEIWREISTLVMLVTLGLVAGRATREKFAYFFLSFGVWDIFYYIFLRTITGWPASFLESDVYFLIPVAWTGPVITPILASSIIILLALILLSKGSKTHEL